MIDRNKIIKAVLWSFIGIAGRQGIVFLVSIFLARILNPDQFGLIAMITVFSNFGQLLLNFGFSQAVIQHSNISQEDLSTIFFFNISMGLAMCGLLYGASVPIAHFYNQPPLINLTRFISLIFIFNAFSIIQRTLLLKNIELKSETTIIILASLISGIIAILLAFNGFGVWALAIKIVSQSLLESLFFWLMNDWRPSWIFKFASLKKLFRFAANMFGAGIFNSLTVNVDNLIIGRLFTASQLGYFERSKNYNSLMQANLGAVFSKVTLPALSNLQNNSEKFLDYYRKMIRMVAWTVVPLFLLFIIIAKPLVVLLITEKWLPSVVLLQILAASGFIHPISAIIVNAIAAKGRADIFFKLDILKTILYIIGILVGSMWGIIGIAVAISLVAFIGFYINIQQLSKLLHLSLLKQLSDIILPVILGIAMFISLLITQKLSDLNMINQLIILPLSGITFYLVMNYIFNRNMLFEMKRLAFELSTHVRFV